MKVIVAFGMELRNTQWRSDQEWVLTCHDPPADRRKNMTELSSE